jgi:hypothetical protein
MGWTTHPNGIKCANQIVTGNSEEQTVEIGGAYGASLTTSSVIVNHGLYGSISAHPTNASSHVFSFRTKSARIHYILGLG